jgi:hypothetical protein
VMGVEKWPGGGPNWQPPFREVNRHRRGVFGPPALLPIDQKVFQEELVSGESWT